MPETLPRRTEARLARIDALAARMDSAFRVPGTRIRVGYDSILGLIPGVGDTLAMAPAAYIMLEGRRLGTPWPLMARMGVNVGLDTVIGAIPLIGDIFDVGFKANRRNAAHIRRHVTKAHEKRPRSAARPWNKRTVGL